MWLAFQLGCNPVKLFDSKIHFSSLNTPHIASINLTGVRQSVLRKANIDSPLADILT